MSLLGSPLLPASMGPLATMCVRGTRSGWHEAGTRVMVSGGIAVGVLCVHGRRGCVPGGPGGVPSPRLRSNGCPRASGGNPAVETKYPHEAAYDAFLCGSVLLKVAHLLLWKVHSAVPIPEPSFPLYLDVLAPYVNQVNLIRAGVPKINFAGPDSPSIRPPILILTVRKWPGVSEQQVYREFQNLCKFDVRRLTRSQFLLMTNKFKDTRSILKEYRCHPTLRISLYRYWRHSPDINCLLQVCSIITTWAFIAFLLGGAGL